MRFSVAALAGLPLLLTSFAPQGALGTPEAAAPAAAPAAASPEDAAEVGSAPPPVEAEPADTVDAPDPLAMPAEGPPVPPEDPAALARTITAAEQAIRDPELAPEELAAAGHWHQIAYRTLVARPEWKDAVIAETPQELRRIVHANVFAGARLSAMYPKDPNKPVKIRPLPRWLIIEPPAPDVLKSFYREAEAASGVHWTYLAAVNLVETRMGRIRGDSYAGAQGPMQFMPPTWAEWGEGDVYDHRDAIMAAGRYLRWGGMPGDVDGALFRYNRDQRYVDAVRTYAEQMQADERAFYGYYHWQVYYDTGADYVWLAPGFDGRS